MNKKHYILIQDSIIEDIEQVMSLPNEYKSRIKELCLSKDSLNITLANEILKTLDGKCNILLETGWYEWPILNRGAVIKDPSRHATLTLV